MYEEFKNRAVGVGAEVYRFQTKRDALDFILPFMQREGVADLAGAYAVWAADSFLDGVDRKELLALPGLSFEVTRQRASQARIGVSQMEWALADTGSLVQDQSAVTERLASSLPAIHIAVVPSANILPDKRALFARLTPQTSRYIAFITGPSRTADIERVLTIGVHGPERLIVVFVDEMGGTKR